MYLILHKFWSVLTCDILGIDLLQVQYLFKTMIYSSVRMKKSHNISLKVHDTTTYGFSSEWWDFDIKRKPIFSHYPCKIWCPRYNTALRRYQNVKCSGLLQSVVTTHTACVTLWENPILYIVCLKELLLQSTQTFSARFILKRINWFVRVLNTFGFIFHDHLW